MGLTKGQQPPVVPHGFAFATQPTAYHLGLLERYQVRYHTAQSVRCQTGTALPRTMKQGALWAFSDEIIWQQVVAAYDQYQACLTILADRLRGYGLYGQVYMKQAKSFGGVRYPLARWVIAAPNPDVASGWLVNERQPPSLCRYQVERHTDKMVMADGGARLFQSQVFVCRSEADWQAVSADHAAAEASGSQFADLLARIPRYRDLVVGRRAHAA